jgi:hypothetical protein
MPFRQDLIPSLHVDRRLLADFGSSSLYIRPSLSVRENLHQDSMEFHLGK